MSKPTADARREDRPDDIGLTVLRQGEGRRIALRTVDPGVEIIPLRI